MVKPVKIRTFLSIVLSKGWSLNQLDINNVFLHGDLSENVYILQPPGFESFEFSNHVCKLKKALYGLKQAPRAWFHGLKNFLIDQGFISSQSDSSLFIKSTNGATICLLVYMDDIIITGTSSTLI
jgi:Reverse transcriptase (RNA-dependent DNA polymerase)